MALIGTPTSYIGLDIGSTSIKLIELVRRQRRIEVATYASVEAPGLFHEIKSEDAKIVDAARLVREMLSAAGASSDSAIVSLPSNEAFATVLAMPPMGEEKMEQAIRFAARDLVPNDISTMALEWARGYETPHLSTGDPKEKGKAPLPDSASMEPKGKEPEPVFVVAIPHTTVQRYQSIAAQAELELVAQESEVFALTRALLSEPGASGMIIDTGAHTTSLHIIHDGSPHVSHTIDGGSNEVTSALAKALGVSAEEAEVEKMRYGLSGEASEHHRVAVEVVLRRHIENAQSLMKTYERSEQKKIPRIVMVGGGANLQGLRAFWEQATGVPVSIGNPWKGLSYPNELEPQLQTISPSYAVAVGLALRGLASSS